MKNLKGSVETRNSVCHSAIILTDALMHMGTTVHSPSSFIRVWSSLTVLRLLLESILVSAEGRQFRRGKKKREEEKKRENWCRTRGGGRLVLVGGNNDRNDQKRRRKTHTHVLR